MLVSDAVINFASTPTSRQSLIPRLSRAFDISAEQVGGVRRRWLVDEFVGKRRTGALWMINTRLEDFPITDARGYGSAVRSFFPRVRTDLNAFTEGEVACLENHGYSMADAAMRGRAPQLCPNVSAPFRWPNDRWCDDSVIRDALGQSGGRRIIADIWNVLRDC
jgi:NTE family protein